MTDSFYVPAQCLAFASDEFLYRGSPTWGQIKIQLFS
jgi:hypothetical protein